MRPTIKKEVTIGVCVLIAMAILFFGINFLKGVNVFKAVNYYYVNYTEVAGLSKSAPVTLNGFKVGLVRDMEYDYAHPGHVIVEISLDKDLKLPYGTKATLGSDILGTASITLNLGTASEYYTVGDTIPAVFNPGMLEALSQQLMPSVSQIFPKIDTLLTNINTLVANPALQASISRLDAITAELEKSAKQLTAMTQSLSSVPAQINPILSDVKTITGNVSNISSDLATVSTTMKEAPIDSILQSMEATTANLRLLSQQLNDPNSSLGQLMNNPALYNNINSTVQSLDSLFVDIKRNPKRYVSIKVF